MYDRCKNSSSSDRVNSDWENTSSRGLGNPMPLRGHPLPLLSHALPLPMPLGAHRLPMIATHRKRIN
ncbi:hypothetical protein E2C01_058285 [Portunus trituberculatus]|uniref:Uncharacterized protein n=1 Tax=Portunus trituberculatus TaxID=210409 RepID=A0A5B7H5N5_PORTR|nr:hypothetical protein [Portunus trituberculatus]